MREEVVEGPTSGHVSSRKMLFERNQRWRFPCRVHLQTRVAMKFAFANREAYSLVCDCGKTHRASRPLELRAKVKHRNTVPEMLGEKLYVAFVCSEVNSRAS